MKCIKCDGETTVLESRISNILKGSPRRRRKCLSCDFRFSTLEIPYDEIPYEREKEQAKKYEARRFF